MAPAERLPFELDDLVCRGQQLSDAVSGDSVAADEVLVEFA